MSTSRIAVVTGGASGIGEATARRLAAAGDAVVIADVDEERGATVARGIEADGGRARFAALDVGEESSVAALLSRVEDEIGPVGVLVNSAGLLQNAVVTRLLDMETHDRIWAVNYRGTYLCCRAFGARMAERGEGSIVNLGSINSFRPLPLPAYTPGKAAIKSLTELLAAELGRHGVRVNAVAPTFTLTPAIKARIESGHRDPEAIRNSSALKMFVTPEHVADGIHFLCSHAAAAITGVTLPIDAGWLAAQSYDHYVAPVEGL